MNNMRPSSKGAALREYHAPSSRTPPEPSFSKSAPIGLNDAPQSNNGINVTNNNLFIRPSSLWKLQKNRKAF